MIQKILFEGMILDKPDFIDPINRSIFFGTFVDILMEEMTQKIGFPGSPKRNEMLRFVFLMKGCLKAAGEFALDFII